MDSILKKFSFDDCYKVLKKKLNSTNFVVKSYEFHPLGVGAGFLGDHNILKIGFNDANGLYRSMEFFAKTMPLDKIRNDFLIECGCFSKECKFYCDVVPEMLKRGVVIIEECIPACYLISDNEYLILENLKVKGYTTESARISLRLDTFKVGLDSLAKLHASGLIFEEKMRRETGRNFHLGEEYPEIYEESFFPYTETSMKFTGAMKTGIETGINLFDEEFNLKNKRMLIKLTFEAIDNIREIVKPSSIYRNTICHSDIWSSNVMFKYEDGKAIHSNIVDFQMFRYGPPAQDFMSYLHLTTDRKFRQKYTKSMMNYYYQKVSDAFKGYDLCPEEVLPYAEFLDSCTFYKVFASVLATNHFILTMIQPEILKELFETEEIADVLFKDRSSIVVKCWKEDRNYRNKICELITDLRDVFSEIE